MNLHLSSLKKDYEAKNETSGLTCLHLMNYKSFSFLQAIIQKFFKYIYLTFNFFQE